MNEQHATRAGTPSADASTTASVGICCPATSILALPASPAVCCGTRTAADAAAACCDPATKADAVAADASCCH